MRELNALNKVIIEKFSSRQAYTQIKGHYIPIIMDDLQDESVTEIEKRKYYIQSYNFTMMGFLMDENEFQVSPGVSRTFTLLETNQKSAKIKKNRNPLDNVTNFNLFFEFPLAVNSFTQVFSYSANLRSIGLDNIDTYDVLINGLFFGSNIFNNPESVIQLNVNDELTISNLTKVDNTIPAKLEVSVELV